MNDSQMNSYFEVNGIKLWYERVGSGRHPVLLIPEAIGTGRTDFDELLDGEDELDYRKFTAIAVDPPGSGRSRPPARQYGVNVYNNDSDCYHRLMEHLGYETYSIIGFSEGARVAFFMAAKYPDSIQSMVLSAFSTHTSNTGYKALMATKTVDKWSKNKINSYLKAYDSKEEIQKQWNRYLKFIEFYNQYFPEDIFRDKFEFIKSRILFTHGEMDPITEVGQPLETRLNILKQSYHFRTQFDHDTRLELVKVHRFPLGERDSHRKYAPQYLKLVQDHILSSGEINNN